MASAKLTRPRETLVRAPRVRTTNRLVVESKTIGTSFSFEFVTDNVSASGMLLTHEGALKIPFAINTILEMTIDPEGKYLKSPVACLAKVIRREQCNADGQPMASGGTTRLGVHIVQINSQDMQVWEKGVNELIDKNGPVRSIAAA